jgi:alginate O-acetyltransferase complex protein AlgJ
MLRPHIASPPPAMRSREEIARIEVGHTAISTGLARAVVTAFLITLASASLAEIVSGGRIAGESVTPWSVLTAVPRDVAAHLSTLTAAGAWAGIVAANRVALAALTSFESELEDGSTIGRSLRPPAQLAVSRWLGAGNERVYPGRDGWLFYRPDVEYLTGRGFLQPAVLEGRRRSVSEWMTPIEPDPRKALLQLKGALDARGITLIVMPTPVKPTVHPGKLADAYRERTTPLHNPSYAAFMEHLAEAGILVLDTSAALAGATAASSQYLVTDTHWRPESMELAAEALVALIGERALLPDVPEPGHRAERVEVRAAGDTVRMLDLPKDQSLYPTESVWLRRVLEADGTPWRPSRQADVLVLGDSFSNVYSLASMGWGDAAGFVEQVSYLLRRPVDRIVQNDEGAFATRVLLWQQRLDRLAGKRVVVYQFAARELASGNWQLLP